MSKLTENQIQRYAHQIILDEIGTKGQEKLLKTKVFILGAGGLGSPVLIYLASAGVGTLGLEAISRGASRAVFVEKDRRVFKILEKNAAQFHAEKIKLFLCDSLQFISHDRNKKFDIIFADPPYIMTDFRELKEKIQSFLKPNGIFCLEMQKHELDETPDRIKYYGKS